MKYLFWNTNNNKMVNEYIKDLMIENNYDLIALAEYNDNIKEMLDYLNLNRREMYNILTPGCDRITLISKIKPRDVISCEETQYYTIKILSLAYGKKQIIASVHLPSKMYADDEDRRIEISYLVKNIEVYEKLYNTKNTVIMGDFNANPFENCMMSVSGLHAASSPTVYANKKSRIVKKREYNMFYNPMWNQFGDFTGAAGTYFYAGSKAVEIFWNIFDQVIIRPQIAHLFVKEGLKIVTQVNGKTLLNKNKIIVSDHLPIEFIIKEEQNV